MPEMRLRRAPDPDAGAYSAPSDPLAGFKTSISKGRGGGQGRGRGKEKGRGKGGIGKGEWERRGEEGGGEGKEDQEGGRKVCLLLNGGLVTPLDNSNMLGLPVMLY